MKKQAVIISAVIVLLNACFLGSALSQITPLCNEGEPEILSLDRITNRVCSEQDQSVKAGEWKYYEIDVPSEATQLNVGLTKISGDVDLYVKKEAEPTRWDYDCTSHKYRNKPETCKLYDNLPGKWFIGVYGWKGGNFDIRVIAHQVKPPADSEEPGDKSFTFAIFGDKTGVYDYDDMPGSNKVLKKAVEKVNKIAPDAPEFVFTVGDLIQGEDHAGWIREKESYQKIMNDLNYPWYPVVGNHDVYRTANRSTEVGKTKPFKKPYEKFFGPLWYAFEYKCCWFIALYVVDDKEMRDKQREWLQNVLNKDEVKKANHVFLFQHRPRWINKSDQWLEEWWFHKELQKLRNEHGVSCTVFFGHLHNPIRKFGRDKALREPENGIRYYALGTTGADSQDNIHKFWTVTVDGESFKLLRYRYPFDKVPIEIDIDEKSDKSRLKWFDDDSPCHETNKWGDPWS